MSGHSKWSTIKRKKEKTDAARGRIFTRLIREITVAARMGGGDPEANPRLRTAVAAAKAANMPSDNVDRAIKKGTGELPGTVYEELQFEGYGPGGCAILLDTMTDNKNRTVSEIRHAFTKHNGNLAEKNSVAFLFERVAQVVVESREKGEEAVMEAALEAGAEDVVEDEENVFTISGQPNDLEAMQNAMEELGVNVQSAEVTMVASTSVSVQDEKQAKSLLKLMEALEDNDDVQKVYSNFDIDEEILATLEE